MELERPLPQPITPEAKPYWDGLREHKLMLPRCRQCRHAFFYPRVLCPHCHAADIEWFKQTLASDFRIVLNVAIFAFLLMAACIPPWQVRDESDGEAYTR